MYAARKIAEHEIRESKISEANYFYIPSLSITTIIYKGIIMPEDIGPYYLDLQEIDLVTRLALVHQRFSTNTMPTWELAQPFRHMCQNGEINTLRGNVSRMRVREEIMKSEVFGSQIEKLFPIILPGKSDSASMDMVVELLTHTGRSLPEIMMMMIPIITIAIITSTTAVTAMFTSVSMHGVKAVGTEVKQCLLRLCQRLLQFFALSLVFIQLLIQFLALGAIFLQ